MGKQGCSGAGMVEYGDMGMQGIWGAGLEECSVLGLPRVQGDGDTQGWRCSACEDTGMQGHSCRPVRCRGGTSGAPHLLCSPKHAGEAGDGEVGHVVGWLLAQAQLTQQLPHHWRQLEPVACGREKEGGDTTIPMTLDSSGVLGWGRGCPRLPEKPAPMTMLLNLGCRSRMKSSSGVFWGARV